MGKRDDIFEEVFNKIITKMEAGNLPPWSKGRKEIFEFGFPHNILTKKAYHGINVWLLLNEEYSRPHWGTYKQIKKLGGFVKKGEHGTSIIFCERRVKEIENEEDDETKKRIIFIYKAYRVFNILQTSLADDERWVIENTNSNNPIEKCEEIAKYIPNEKITMKQGRPAYSFVTDDIFMPGIETYDNSERYYSSLFHEMVHSTGHKNRLNRKFGKCYGTDIYSKEELIAEMGAAMLCGISGISTEVITNQTAYLKGWLKELKSEKGMLIWAASGAQKAVNFIER